MTFYFQRSPRLFTIKSHHRRKATTAVTEYRERERGADGWELHCSKRVDNTSDGPKLRVWYGLHNAVSSANVLRITHRVNNVAVRLAFGPCTHHFPQLGFACGTRRRRLNCFLFRNYGHERDCDQRPPNKPTDENIIENSLTAGEEVGEQRRHRYQSNPNTNWIERPENSAG